MKRSYFWMAIVVTISLGVAAVLGLALNFDFSSDQKLPKDIKYSLPALSYGYSSLEPYIDKETMMIHYTKHHQAYVDNLNAVLKDYPKFYGLPVEYLIINLDKLPENIRSAVRNNAGGHYNHSFFWKILGPAKSSRLTGVVKAEINKKFGSFDKFKEEFSLAAKKVFGSGWAWLCFDPAHKKLLIVSTKDQDSPLSKGFVPVLGLDVWEHAYYLKYQNRRVDYIDSWWHVINWDAVELNYKNAINFKF